MKEVMAKITGTSLGIEDHGIFTAWLDVTYDGKGTSQSIGGYALDEWDDATKHRVGTAYGLEWIKRVMAAAGVDRWEKLVGRTVFILKTEEQSLIGGYGALGIRPLPTEKGTEFIFESINHLAQNEDSE